MVLTCHDLIALRVREDSGEGGGYFQVFLEDCAHGVRQSER